MRRRRQEAKFFVSTINSPPHTTITSHDYLPLPTLRDEWKILPDCSAFYHMDHAWDYAPHCIRISSFISENIRAMTIPTNTGPNQRRQYKARNVTGIRIIPKTK